MTTPHPTTEAVEAAARGLWEDVQHSDPVSRLEPVSWDDTEDGNRNVYRYDAEVMLTAAYSQIVTDVLNHYADQVTDQDYTMGIATYLRSQAKEVTP